MRKALSLALFGSLVASVAVAGPITDEQLASLKIGTTTFDEVVATFGKPMTVETTSDGAKTITYAVIKAHAKAVSYVPVVGLFAGGAKGTSQSERFEFDPKGVLTKITTSETDIECGIWSGCGSKR